MTTAQRKAGWAAITSGAIGILSFGALMTAVMTRDSLTVSKQVNRWFRIHDAGVIMQLLLLLPGIYALYDLSLQKATGISKGLRNTGITSVVCTVILLLMIFPNLAVDILYMFPQGQLGVWLIIVNWKLNGTLPALLRWFGIIVGIGLVMVGIFPPGYAISVDPILFHIPAPAPEVIENIPVNTPANIFLHQLLWIGSLMGVLPLPIWTIFFGIRLLKNPAISILGNNHPERRKL